MGKSPTAQEIADEVKDPLLLFEAAWIASNNERYRRNNFVTNVATAWANVGGQAKDLQDRLDQRTERRAENRKDDEEPKGKPKAKA